MKCNKLCLVICFLLVFVSASIAQITFVKTFGNSNLSYGIGYSVQQTSDGGFIMTGATNLYPTSFINLIKTNANGDTLWTRTYGHDSIPIYFYRYSVQVQQTTDGGYVVVGTYRTSNANPADIYLIRTNSNGDTLWTKSYGSTGKDYGYSVKQTADSGFIIAGATDSLGAGSYDVFLIKTNSIGDTIWTKTYGGINNDWARSVELTLDGGYIIAGYTNSFGAGNNDVYIVKTDSIGNILWTKTYGSVGDEYGYSVKQTSDGGYIVAGSNIYLIKTNSIGDTLWTKTSYGDGSYIPTAYSVQQTTDGGFIIAGTALNWVSTTLSKVFLLKTNSTGDALWAKVFEYGGYSGGFAVQQTTDEGYIITGFEGFSASIVLIKTDTNGNSGCWQYTYPTPYYSLPSQVSNTATIVHSGCMVSNPSRSVGSGDTTVTTYCFTTGINETAIEVSINIYPNPVQDNFTINTSAEILNANLEIRNILGEKIYSTKLTSQQTNINNNEFPSGIYFITIRMEEKVITKKLIVNK